MQTAPTSNRRSKPNGVNKATPAALAPVVKTKVVTTKKDKTMAAAQTQKKNGTQAKQDQTAPLPGLPGEAPPEAQAAPAQQQPVLAPQNVQIPPEFVNRLLDMVNNKVAADPRYAVFVEKMKQAIAEQDAVVKNTTQAEQQVAQLRARSQYLLGMIEANTVTCWELGKEAASAPTGKAKARPN